MPDEVNNWLNLIFRWTHVVAGVMWIGHLWFFNFVNAQVAKTYDADSKKKVVPELMPRALYWFRWGAAWTWLTGFLLLVFTYYMTAKTLAENPGLAHGISIGVILVSFFIYDPLWKAMAKQEMAGAAISFVLIVGLAFGLAQVFTGRAVIIHIGAVLGTIMAMNVWMRIWPNQRRIIAAIKGGTAPDPANVALAGLRSKHNTYMSFPLIFFMLVQHEVTMVYGTSNDAVFVPIWVAVFVAAGWGLAKFCFGKSASAAPTQFMPAESAAPPAEAQK